MQNAFVDEITFRDIFMKCLEDISIYINEDIIKTMARNNAGYGRASFNLTTYYRIEYKKYYLAYKRIAQAVPPQGKVCDCGGFLGVFAYVLSETGYKVSIVEALKYYTDSLEPLYDFLGNKGIEVIDFDMFEREKRLEKQDEKFDMVCAMDVIEHYPYSLKYYIDNMKRMAKPEGYLYFTAPNIAVFHKRWSFLMNGITPLASIEEIYSSDIPFTGHCHEMTMRELEQIAELSDLNVVAKGWNSSFYYAEGMRKNIYRLIHKCFPNTRENLEILLKKK